MLLMSVAVSSRLEPVLPPDSNVMLRVEVKGAIRTSPVPKSSGELIVRLSARNAAETPPLDDPPLLTPECGPTSITSGTDPTVSGLAAKNVNVVSARPDNVPT